jgi:hypothetical protein
MISYLHFSLSIHYLGLETQEDYDNLKIRLVKAIEDALPENRMGISHDVSLELESSAGRLRSGGCLEDD